jgi:glycine oxidase
VTRVAVIGGGIIGLATAWRCAQRGLAVTVYDPAPGGGAGQVAAGMLAPAIEARAGEEALQELLTESARRWPAFARELAAVSGTNPGYREDGTLLVAVTDDDVRVLDRLSEFHARAGLPVQPMTVDALRELEPLLTPRLRGGAYAAGDRQVDPRRVLAALLAAVRHESVAVVQAAVTDLSTVDADVVVVAAGYASAALAGLPVRPVKGQVVRVRAAESGLRHVIWGLAGGRVVYLVPRADGEIVIGATEEEQGADVTVTAGAILDLLRPAVDIVPELVEYRLTETLAGLRPTTPDNVPFLGVLRPGVIVATGHYRNGVLLTPVTADAVAKLVETGKTPPEIEPFSPARWTGAV